MKSSRTRHGKALLLAGDMLFLHVGAFVDVIDRGGQHLVIPMTDDTSDWRAAVLERVSAVHPSLVPLVASIRCTPNSKEMGAVCTPEDLENANLRLHVPGLLGGAPKAQDVATTKVVDKMKKDDVMHYAKQVLGVEVRQAGHDGETHRYRAVEDVKKECKAVQARLCQRPHENVPSSSSREAPLPAPERAPSVEDGCNNQGRKKQAARQNAANPGLGQMCTQVKL